MDDQKWCVRCEKWKPRATDFYKKRDNRDGLHSYCKECGDSKATRWQQQHRETVAAQKRIKRATDPLYKDYQNTYRDRKREHLRSIQRAWRERNTATLQARRSAWQRGHLDYHAAKQHQRRAKLRGCTGLYTPSEWQSLCAAYDNRCLCCGCDGPLTVDHVVPVSKGGNNDITNIQPLCQPCNSRKGVQIIDYRP